MNYRAEIDGLRAVAVTSVVLYHAGLGPFPGGFVGVDVFFVISGYLITSILIGDLRKKRFSLAAFYERRARRILPALFAVMLACLPFAWAWMGANQLDDFGQSVVAVILFASNLLFWKEGGYFAGPAELKPLLHTWSLAVEEQFYILFPLLLAALWPRGPRRILRVLAGLAAASLLLGETLLRLPFIDQDTVFYLLPTRAWELLAGSLCALLVARRSLRPDGRLAGLGLLLILGPVLAYDESTMFPGLHAVPPVAGTALLILWGGAGTGVAALLSARPVVGLGLVSYSLYLWHQPIFALARIRLADEPGPWLMAALVGLSLALALLTWRFVEQPFRDRSRPFLQARSRVFGLSAAASLAFLALGVFGALSGGVPGRLPPQVLAVDAAAGAVFFNCGRAPLGTCRIGAEDGQGGIALVGDSHAGRYAHWLTQALAAQGRQIRLMEGGWCPPLLGFRTLDEDKNADQCGGPYQAALAALVEDPSIHTVVLAARWGLYTTGRDGDAPLSAYAYADSGNTDPAANPEEFRRAFAATIEALRAAGKRIVVVGPVPEYEFHVPNRLRHLAMFDEAPEELRLPHEAYLARNDAVLAAFADHAGAFDLVDPRPALCDDRGCIPHDENLLPLYSDANHLSALGLERVAPLVLKALVRPAGAG